MLCAWLDIVMWACCLVTYDEAQPQLYIRTYIRCTYGMFSWEITIHMVILAGNSPHIRSCMVHIYDSGQPYPRIKCRELLWWLVRLAKGCVSVWQFGGLF
jgi:hypothetical protein